MVLLIPWLHAKQKHVEKYCSIYTDRDFDVVVVTPSEFDVIKPKIGSQLLAKDVVNFLVNNEYYNKMVIQGFSVAGYFWSECLFHLHSNGQFESISERFKCQVWDSVTGMRQIPIGVSKSFFPNNQILQNFTKSSLDFYLKTFYESATQYYIRGEENFHNKPLKAPALIFSSKIDPVATFAFANGIVNSFKQLEIDVTFKSFDDSPHVQIYNMHKQEYLSCLDNHLKRCQMT